MRPPRSPPCTPRTSCSDAADASMPRRLDAYLAQHPGGRDVHAAEVQAGQGGRAHRSASVCPELSQTASQPARKSETAARYPVASTTAASGELVPSVKTTPSAENRSISPWTLMCPCLICSMVPMSSNGTWLCARDLGVRAVRQLAQTHLRDVADGHPDHRRGKRIGDPARQVAHDDPEAEARAPRRTCRAAAC